MAAVTTHPILCTLCGGDDLSGPPRHPGRPHRVRLQHFDVADYPEYDLHNPQTWPTVPCSCATCSQGVLW